MVYTELTKKAMLIAYNAHNGQFDKGGYPYIHHPIHLAEQMETEDECIVALLHDVVEDTDVTFEQLSEIFSDTIIEALKLLTHDDSVEYFHYIVNIRDSHNDIAKKVKLADLYHNSDLKRINQITPGSLRRTAKYQAAIKILSE
jgi:(p)ppGpp synthase/HD superfamily hydrolase